MPEPESDIARRWRVFRASIQHEVQRGVFQDEVDDEEQVRYPFTRHRVGFKRVQAAFLHRKGNRSKYEKK